MTDTAAEVPVMGFGVELRQLWMQAATTLASWVYQRRMAEGHPAWSEGRAAEREHARTRRQANPTARSMSAEERAPRAPPGSDPRVRNGASTAPTAGQKWGFVRCPPAGSGCSPRRIDPTDPSPQSPRSAAPTHHRGRTGRGTARRPRPADAGPAAPVPDPRRGARRRRRPRHRRTRARPDRMGEGGRAPGVDRQVRRPRRPGQQQRGHRRAGVAVGRTGGTRRRISRRAAAARCAPAPPLRPRSRSDDRVPRGAEVSGSGVSNLDPEPLANQSTPRCRGQIGSRPERTRRPAAAATAPDPSARRPPGASS
jgi:hypothetical protein